MKQFASAEREPAVSTPDGATRRVLSYGPKLMMVQFTFDSGVTSNPHTHPHEQIGYVVSGLIDVFMEGMAPVRLSAGGSYFVPSNLRHNIATLAPTVLIDCFTPIREDFITPAR